MEDEELSPPQLLKALVSVVATLGKVAAAVTGSHRDVRQRVSPKFLPAALRRFTQSLRETLDHGDVTSLGQRGVPSLGRALAALGATPGTTWADVRAAAEAWRESVAAHEESWKQLHEEATELCVACADAAPARVRDLWYSAAHQETIWHNLAATAWQPPVALDSEDVAWAGASSEEEELAISEEELATSMQELAISEEELATSEEEEAPSEAVGEAVVASSRARVATRRGHWAEVALGPLESLLYACDSATMFIRNMDSCLWEIRIILNSTNEESPDVPEALVAKVAEFEQLWDASARLAKDRLLGILELIDNILLNPYAGPAGPGGPGGPGSRAVAELRENAIKDIPRLLQGQ